MVDLLLFTLPVKVRLAECFVVPLQEELVLLRTHDFHAPDGNLAYTVSLIPVPSFEELEFNQPLNVSVADTVAVFSSARVIV